MTYQINQLAQLAGVSVRTLRYYDQIGLLKPAKVGSNGYRYYERTQVDRLQQICFYRTLRLPLATIQQLLERPRGERVAGLEAQYQTLLAERQRIDQLLTLVQTIIKTQREDVKMNDEAKFQDFKTSQLTQNTEQYGDELLTKYDAETLRAANTKFANLSAADYQRMQAVEQQLLTQLKTALNQATLAPDTIREVYELHRQWLSFTWPKYTAQMHRGLAQMYLSDPRFISYYDERAGHGATALLAKIITQAAHD